MSVLAKISKYLLFLAVFFTFLVSAHLVVAYLYHDSTILPEEGGTISIGLVGDVPSLNPLEYGMHPKNDIVLRYLYRSMLRYDPLRREVVGDIGNCDLGQNFSIVQCYPNQGLWSDGTPITTEDILQTYRTLSESDINPALKAILSEITIEDTGEYIAFRTDNPDVEIITLFLAPIVSAEEARQIRRGILDLEAIPASWPYTYAWREGVDSYNSEKITLVKNPNFWGDERIYIGRTVFRFFPDEQTLLKNESILNVIPATETTPPPESPRFEPVKTLLPQYISLFLNSEEVPADIRNIVLFHLENTQYASLSSDRWKVMPDIFFGNPEPHELLSKNIAEPFNILGFYKRDTLIHLYSEEIEALEQWELPDSSTPAEPAPAIPANTHFSAPTSESIYFFSGNSEGELILSWSVPADTTAVLINGYRLSRYVPGSGTFLYRSRLDLGNLREGENIYRLTLERAGQREEVETLTVYYSPDAARLAEIRGNVMSEYTTPEPETPDPDTVEKARTGLEKSLAQVEKLDNTYYYNRDFVRYTLDMLYTNQSHVVPELVWEISEALKLIGIHVNHREISLEEMRTIIDSDQKTYDMLLTGVHLGTLGYNIFPFFHSGQAESGFNFSKIKSIPLDVELETLKSRFQKGEDLASVQETIRTLVHKEHAVLPYYASYRTWYVDRNLENIPSPELLPSSAHLVELTRDSSIIRRYGIEWDMKTGTDFFSWISESIR